MISAGTINIKINGTFKGDYLPFSKPNSILAVANLFAHNNIWLCYYGQVNSVYKAKIECSFEMGK